MCTPCLLLCPCSLGTWQCPLSPTATGEGEEEEGHSPELGYDYHPLSHFLTSLAFFSLSHFPLTPHSICHHCSSLALHFPHTFLSSVALPHIPFLHPFFRPFLFSYNICLHLPFLISILLFLSDTFLFTFFFLLLFLLTFPPPPLLL